MICFDQQPKVVSGWLVKQDKQRGKLNVAMSCFLVKGLSKVSGTASEHFLSPWCFFGTGEAGQSTLLAAGLLCLKLCYMAELSVAAIIVGTQVPPWTHGLCAGNWEETQLLRTLLAFLLFGLLDTIQGANNNKP